MAGRVFVPRSQPASHPVQAHVPGLKDLSSIQVKYGTDEDINRIGDSLSNSELYLGTPLEELLSHGLLRQLQESREEEERSIVRRKEEDRIRENERREMMMLECEKTLKNIWIDLGILVLHDKTRKCSPSYFQSALASMHNAIREIKGINEVKAGHRHQQLERFVIYKGPRER